MRFLYSPGYLLSTYYMSNICKSCFGNEEEYKNYSEGRGSKIVGDICYILEGKEMEIFIPNINISHLKINI